MELLEIFGDSDVIVEEIQENKNVAAMLHYVFIVGDQTNLNGRTYPSKILEREISNMKSRIAKSGIAGQLDHPMTGLTELSRVSHLVTDVEWDKEEKKGKADSAILKTTAGKDLLLLLNSNLQLGASVRGRGTVNAAGVVQDDYSMESIDVVLHPSFGKGVQISKANLIESGNKYFPGFLTEEELKVRFRFARLSGFQGGFSEFLKGLKK